MAEITNETLVITTVGFNSTIDVTYDAVLTSFERSLVDLGAPLHSHIDV